MKAIMYGVSAPPLLEAINQMPIDSIIKIGSQILITLITLIKLLKKDEGESDLKKGLKRSKRLIKRIPRTRHS